MSLLDEEDEYGNIDVYYDKSNFADADTPEDIHAVLYALSRLKDDTLPDTFLNVLAGRDVHHTDHTEVDNTIADIERELYTNYNVREKSEEEYEMIENTMDELASLVSASYDYHYNEDFDKTLKSLRKKYPHYDIDKELSSDRYLTIPHKNKDVIMLAIRGTDPNTWDDWWSDIDIGFGQHLSKKKMGRNAERFHSKIAPVLTLTALYPHLDAVAEGFDAQQERKRWNRLTQFPYREPTGLRATARMLPVIRNPLGKLILNNPKVIKGAIGSYIALLDRYILRPLVNKIGGWDDAYKGLLGTGVELASLVKRKIRPFSDFKYRLEELSDVYDKIQEKYPNKKIVPTGHSLGGTLSLSLSKMKGVGGHHFNMGDTWGGYLSHDDLRDYRGEKQSFYSTTYKSKLTGKRVGDWVGVLGSGNKYGFHYIKNIDTSNPASVHPISNFILNDDERSGGEWFGNYELKKDKIDNNLEFINKHLKDLDLRKYPNTRFKKYLEHAKNMRAYEKLEQEKEEPLSWGEAEQLDDLIYDSLADHKPIKRFDKKEIHKKEFKEDVNKKQFKKDLRNLENVEQIGFLEDEQDLENLLLYDMPPLDLTEQRRRSGRRRRSVEPVGFLEDLDLDLDDTPPLDLNEQRRRRDGRRRDGRRRIVDRRRNDNARRRYIKLKEEFEDVEIHKDIKEYLEQNNILSNYINGGKNPCDDAEYRRRYPQRCGGTVKRRIHKIE
jgi:hypothetical protein